MEDQDEKGLFVKVPHSGGQKYMYLSDGECKQIGEETWQFDFDSGKTFEIYNENKMLIEKMDGNKLLKYWDEKKRGTEVRSVISKEEQVPSYTSQKSNINPIDSYLAFTINKATLFEGFDNGRIFCKIPRTGGTKYMFLEQDQWRQISKYTFRYFFDPNKKVKIYSDSKDFIEEINGIELLKYWDKKSISKLTEIEKAMLAKKSGQGQVKGNNRILEMTNKSQFDESLYRKKKTIRYYIKRARKWQKNRNIGISDSEIYREMMEWERMNNIGHKL